MGRRPTYVFSFMPGVKTVDEQRAKNIKANEQNKKYRKQLGRKLSVTNRMRKYGLTEEQFMNMLREQEFKCATCDASVSPDDTFATHIDHCHSTGAVRGVLCRLCNLALGYARDNPDTLDRMAAYLRKNRN